MVDRTVHLWIAVLESGVEYGDPFRYQIDVKAERPEDIPVEIVPGTVLQSSYVLSGFALKQTAACAYGIPYLVLEQWEITAYALFAHVEVLRNHREERQETRAVYHIERLVVVLGLEIEVG